MPYTKKEQAYQSENPVSQQFSEESQTELQTRTQTELQTELQTGTQTELQTELQTGTQTGTGTELQTGTGTELQTGTQTGLEAGIEAGIRSGIQGGEGIPSIKQVFDYYVQILNPSDITSKIKISNEDIDLTNNEEDRKFGEYLIRRKRLRNEYSIEGQSISLNQIIDHLDKRIMYLEFKKGTSYEDDSKNRLDYNLFVKR